MGKLIYGMLTSLDGYTQDEHGDFTWAAPEEPVIVASAGTAEADVQIVERQ
jgi:hypothetical protein